MQGWVVGWVVGWLGGGKRRDPLVAKLTQRLWCSAGGGVGVKVGCGWLCRAWVQGLGVGGDVLGHRALVVKVPRRQSHAVAEGRGREWSYRPLASPRCWGRARRRGPRGRVCWFFSRGPRGPGTWTRERCPWLIHSCGRLGRSRALVGRIALEGGPGLGWSEAPFGQVPRPRKPTPLDSAPSRPHPFLGSSAHLLGA